MAGRPTLFTWDTSNTNVMTPPAALIASGWHDGDIPPAAFENWAWMNIYLNLSYLQSAPPVYDSLPAALADNLVGGNTFIVKESCDYPALEEINSKALPNAASAYACIDVCSTGGHIIVFELGASAAYRYPRPYLDAISVITTYTKTSAGTNVRCISDGVYTVLAYGTHVECFNAITGASIWDKSHTAAVHDIAFLQDGNVLAVGNRTAGNETMRVYALADGTETVTAFDHGAHLYAVCVAGNAIYVAGAASSFASGATLRRLKWLGSSIRGYDTECGLTADTTGVCWDVVAANVVTSRCLCTDGRALYSGYDNTAAYAIDMRSCRNGQVYVTQYGTPNFDMQTLRIDQSFVVAAYNMTAGGQGKVELFSTDALLPIAVYNAAAGISTYVAESDGARIFSGREIAAAGAALVYHYRPNRPQLFTRVDPYAAGVAQYFGPWRTWLHRPSEG